MTEDEYLSHDGLALAGLLSAGEVTSEELMACAIGLARTRAPVLNALCHERFDESLALARSWKPRGTFRGIPFLLKDSGLASTRFPSGIGSRLFANMTFPRNATLVDRFERAGFLTFARTTVPELCMAPTTEANSNGGPTRNPWDLSLSSGGSSGGAAAAVAAGIVPVAHGSDGGGSIRVPAACCGVYGLKPSRGLVPMGPFRGEGWGGLACDGVLTRSVRDTAAALDAIAGRETGAPYAAPVRRGSYLAAISKPLRKPLRIAVWSRAWSDIKVDSKNLAAVERAAALCRDLGHVVMDAEPPVIDYDGFIEALINVMASNIVVSSNARLAVLGRTLEPDDLEPAIRDGYDIGKRISAAQYVDGINRFHAIGRVLDTVMQDCDIVLTPALTRLPAQLGDLSTRIPSFTEFRRKVSHYTPFLAVINAAGLPAACLPLSWTDSGLPVASQLIARFGREDMILRLSAELESSTPWASRKPPIFEASHQNLL